MAIDPQNLPLDRESTDALAANGLEYRLVDSSDESALDNWIHGESRGFHYPSPTGDALDYDRLINRQRRVAGVYDDEIPHPEIPVATVSGWPSGLSVPGDRSVESWAISSVTVAPTHRRRGIARALLLAELRNARASGAALAMLTATEATIYGRYGFAPAARIAQVTIDRGRARWRGPDAPGRVQFIHAAEIREQLDPIVRRAVARTPGEVDRWLGAYDRALGLASEASANMAGRRIVRYEDIDGAPQGFVSYHVERVPDRPGILHVDAFVAASDEAEHALWRFLVEYDFVTEIRTELRSVDEPLPWLLTDQRAVRIDAVSDHLWVRVLDVPRALVSRSYGTPGTLELAVTDELDYATGRYLLEVALDGDVSVRELEPGDAPSPSCINLDVRELGAMLLGGTRPSVLTRAGRIVESAPGAATLADHMFASERTPHLGIWF